MSLAEQELRRGWQIHQQKQYAEAEQIYRSVLSQHPSNGNGWCYLGIVLHDQRKYAEAVDAYRAALKLNPIFPVALNNLGNSLRYIGEFVEADRSFQRALELKPDYLNAFKNRGTLHVWTGNLELGLSYYAKALELSPDDAELHRNLGVIYLLQGDFERGWDEYRWRWKVGDLHRPFQNVPVWDGSDLEGKAIVLTAEQGLGDTLNFVRFASMLQDRGANTLVYCQPKLVPILQATGTFGTVFPNSGALNHAVHQQSSLLDVADLTKTTAVTIPGDEAYLQSNAKLDQYWKKRTPGDASQLRIGIAWQGNPEHQADVFRSTPLSQFEVLSEMDGVELVSLQSGFGTEQLVQWQGRRPIHRLPEGVDTTNGSFMDTASIMKQLDLVITSDTSIAHLAGALGIPTWIALGYVPDWRWLLGRDDSPWYSSVRLFRQPSMGDWGGVFSQMSEQLREVVSSRSAAV